MTAHARDTFLRDQAAAAAADARRTLTFATGMPSVHPCQTAYASPSPWLRDHLERIASDVAERRLRRCPHIKGAAPTVVVAMAWRPGRLFCLACSADQFAAVRGTVEDGRCDVCGDLVDVIHPDLVAVGPLLFSYGSCGPCLPVAPGSAVA